MMDIRTFQEQTAAMCRAVDAKRGVVCDKETIFFHIAEETGEIARTLYNERTQRTTVTKKEVADEIADVMMLLSYFATLSGIDLSVAVEEKLTADTTRFGVAP